MSARYSGVYIASMVLFWELLQSADEYVRLLLLQQYDVKANTLDMHYYEPHSHLLQFALTSPITPTAASFPVPPGLHPFPCHQLLSQFEQGDKTPTLDSEARYTRKFLMDGFDSASSNEVRSSASEAEVTTPSSLPSQPHHYQYVDGGRMERVRRAKSQATVSPSVKLENIKELVGSSRKFAFRPFDSPLADSFALSCFPCFATSTSSSATADKQE